MRKAAQIRHDLALSENQLPSRFFEATQLGEVLETARDVATAKNISVVARVQTMVEYLEIFIVSVYAATLTDILTGHEMALPWKQLLVSLAAALSATVTAGVVLEHRTERQTVAAVAAILVLCFAVAGVTWTDQTLPWWSAGAPVLVVFITLALERYRAFRTRGLERRGG